MPEMIAAAQLRQLMPAIGAQADRFAPLLMDTARRYGIDTPRRVSAWLSQISVETRQLCRLVESFSYSDPGRVYLLFPHAFRDFADAQAVHAKGQEAIANRVYADRYGNGAESSGDGWKFRGRGCMMTTFLDNYQETGDAIGLDLVRHPELLEQPINAIEAAGVFWQSKDLNRFADVGDIVTVSKRINGGTNGLNERIAAYNRAMPIFCGQ